MKDTIKILEAVESISSVYLLANGDLIIKPQQDKKFFITDEPIDEFLIDIKVLYNNQYEEVYLIGDKYYVVIGISNWNNINYEMKIREITLDDSICMKY